MKLIMRADDLGFSEAVNLGIYKAVKDGVITSVGIMTNMEQAYAGYELLKDFDIALGQHTNICAGRPLTDPKLIPSLVQENGEFCSSREIRNRQVDTIVVEEAEREIEAQYLRFKEMTGRNPDYFECHAVISQNFFTALKNVAKKYGLFYENILFDQEFEKENNIYGIAMAKLNEKMLYDPKEYVENNYIYDITMQEAAEEMGYSDAYFSKLFKQYFNQNFTAYLTEYRIKKAKELLGNTNNSIKDISRMVGYTDSNYFAKIFKRIVGEIPSKYRENL